MLNKNQTADVRITGYTSEGEGVCRIDGCAVFVPNAVLGEVCRVRITHVSRNSAHGKIEQILERSPHRISRTCPDAKQCGGCQLHHMDYAEELRFKARKVTDALTRIGGVDLREVGIGDPIPQMGEREAETAGQAVGEAQSAQEGTASGCVGTDEPVSYDAAFRDLIIPITGADTVSAYRNKAQYPLAVQNGKPVAGFYRSRTHEVVPIARCDILPEEFDEAKDVILRWAEENRVSVYDEGTGKGLLRHIYVRKGAVSGQIMVCIVANGDRLPREQRLIETLRREIPGLASIILSVNRKNTNVVLGDEFHTLWGQEQIEDVLCGFAFRLSPRSFYQVNHDQAQRLYEKAIEFADLHGTETVLDLYCGTGTITLALSRRAKKAVGVEVVPQAIEDAKENARRNGVTNTEFYCADAGEAAKRFARQQTAGSKQETSCSGQQAVQGPAQSLPLEGKVPPQGADKVEPDFQPAAITAGPDVIVVDPPRKGLAPEVIDAVVQMSPARIVYVSCDPATLARDVKLLTEKGYALTRAEAFDLFPRTFHVETVVSLSQLKSDV